MACNMKQMNLAGDRRWVDRETWLRARLFELQSHRPHGRCRRLTACGPAVCCLCEEYDALPEDLKGMARVHMNGYERR